MESDTKRSMLRHTVATLAYRGGKAVRGVSDSFASFKASETTRTPAEILAHVGDLLDWALSIAEGNETWHNAEPLPWNQEVARFHAALAKLDEYLASDRELNATCERLFQGPIADALTHVGQIAMLLTSRRPCVSLIEESQSQATIQSARTQRRYLPGVFRASRLRRWSSLRRPIRFRRRALRCHKPSPDAQSCRCRSAVR